MRKVKRATAQIANEDHVKKLHFFYCIRWY